MHLPKRIGISVVKLDLAAKGESQPGAVIAQRLVHRRAIESQKFFATLVLAWAIAIVR